MSDANGDPRLVSTVTRGAPVLTMEEAERSGPAPAMPRTVWALGLISLFMDLSSEIIHALLPLFLTVTLGVGVATVGLIDGIAESTAAISRVDPWCIFQSIAGVTRLLPG